MNMKREVKESEYEEREVCVAHVGLGALPGFQVLNQFFKISKVPFLVFKPYLLH